MNFFEFILLFLLFNRLVFAAVLVPCASCNVLNYRESEPELAPYKAFTFDEEVVVCFFKIIDNSPNTTNFCLESRIDLRWIHKDGSIEASQVDFTFPVPELNFCPSPDTNYPLDIHRLSDSILITYMNSSDISTASYYGLIVNKSGKPVRFVIK